MAWLRGLKMTSFMESEVPRASGAFQKLVDGEAQNLACEINSPAGGPMDRARRS